MLRTPRALTSLSRSALAARGYATEAPWATIQHASGVKIAAADHGEATSSVTVLVKAGSRYEAKPGLAHVLQNFAFKVRRGCDSQFDTLAHRTRH